MTPKLGKIRRYETTRRGWPWRKLLAALLLLLLLFFGWLVLSPDPKGVLILEYHMVDTQEDEDSHPYNVPPEDFAAQLDDLAQQGYTTITVHDFLLAKKGKAQLPEKPIILTFDDGYEDNYTQMLPILQAHGMTAVVYVATNLIGQPGYLSWDELRALSAAGIEIGGHTARPSAAAYLHAAGAAGPDSSLEAPARVERLADRLRIFLSERRSSRQSSGDAQGKRVSLRRHGGRRLQHLCHRPLSAPAREYPASALRHHRVPAAALQGQGHDLARHPPAPSVIARHHSIQEDA
jgi:hypothetical protein